MNINGYDPYKKGFDMLAADIKAHEKKAEDELARLRRIEAAAVAAVEYEQWTGGTFYDLMIDLQKAVRGEKT